MKAIIITIGIIFYTLNSYAYEEIKVEHKGKDQIIHYDLYIPNTETEENYSVLVCTGGLPIIDGKYVHSDPTECSTEAWKTFAKENNMAILGLGFLFKDEDWQQKKSYQFPKAWSGKALNKILKVISKEHPINKRKLFLYGISAGAQFSVRYAFFNPRSVQAVAAHAAGGYDKPKRFIKTKFLITVGALDNKEISRVEWAKFFVQNAREKNIFVRPVLIPNIGHRQTEPQNVMSRQFFKEVLEEGS